MNIENGFVATLEEFNSCCLPEGGEGSSLRAGLTGTNPSTLSSLMPPGELSADGVGPSRWLSNSVLHTIYIHVHVHMCAHVHCTYHASICRPH